MYISVLGQCGKRKMTMVEENRDGLGGFYQRNCVFDSSVWKTAEALCKSTNCMKKKKGEKRRGDEEKEEEKKTKYRFVEVVEEEEEKKTRIERRRGQTMFFSVFLLQLVFVSNGLEARSQLIEVVDDVCRIVPH
uniref:C-type lectin domain-containing protein n=1 Tax=Caenorhabditis tropicalis TaxID=1561998 RepID=A0A1I7TRV1_9PELO